jgi:RNA polymerase sigma-70 factor, ECF subfamily
MTSACMTWASAESETLLPAHTAMLPQAADETPRATAVGISEDDVLLQRVAEDDEESFRELVERHIDRAYGLALRILGNAADADDVVQDTFLKVWVHRGRWECGRAKFSTWIYRVVTNRCIDLRRQPTSESVDNVPEPADQHPDVVAAMQRQEMKDKLDMAMRRLPDQQRIAVILSYHEGMSNLEIAEVMETTVSAVESLLKRGRQQLRKLLHRWERDIRQSFADD